MRYAIELSGLESARVLEQACAEGRGAFVQPKSWRGRPWPAVLTGCREGQLELQLHLDHAYAEVDLPSDPPPQSAAPEQGLLNTYCTVELELEDGRYFFESHILTARPRGEGLHLSMAAPPNILVQQRRRARRSAIASSSIVQLSRQDDDRLTCQGRMYNLSPEGLACQVSTGEARIMGLGEPWWVCFELPEQAQWYKLGARVCRQVPSSAEGFVIVGMEFERHSANAEQLDRLQGFLAERQRVQRPGGPAPTQTVDAAHQGVAHE